MQVSLYVKNKHIKSTTLFSSGFVLSEKAIAIWQLSFNDEETFGYIDDKSVKGLIELCLKESSLEVKGLYSSPEEADTKQHNFTFTNSIRFEFDGICTIVIPYGDRKEAIFYCIEKVQEIYEILYKEFTKQVKEWEQNFEY